MPTIRYKTALFIFRRDLRIEDNLGLINALADSEKVIPCFIFDHAQITNKNRYKSSHAIQFMLESLFDLDKQLHKHKAHLYFFYGTPSNIVKKLIKTQCIQAVFVNRDYTPFSIKRDRAIKNVCTQHNIDFHSYADVLLNEPEAIVKNDGTPYTIFTPFFKRAYKDPVAKPINNTHKNFFTKSIKGSHPETFFKKISPQPNKNIFTHGGRSNALKILNNLSDFRNYTHDRDYPAFEKTTGLSAHLKFGTCSIREAWHTIAKQLGHTHPLIRQLYWRDFFTHIAFNFPHVFGHAFHKKYDCLPWKDNKKLFDAWCQGKTGFPIVDAGMRQLNATGFMHNRVRMIVASFLTKDLHIDWRLGERYFATKLIDYDPSVNNGNWQWAASTGADALPYFRIFNPWLQQKKFDKNCLYIKKWVPELKNIPVQTIHTLFKTTIHLISNYPKPIINHEQEAPRAKFWFKTAVCKEIKLRVR